MSQAGEQTNPPSGGGEEETTPLSALAPDAALQEESLALGPTHVSASPAFQCLDQLFSTGKISGTKAAKLKASFSLLHDTLKSSQQSEIRLLQEAKRFRAELERQQRDLETAEQFPEGPDTEVSRMRQQLLKFHNDLRQAEERDYQMNYQLECLTEEKLCLEKEYESQPKPVELEKRAKALKDSSEELRKEVSQRRQEIHSLLEDMEARHKLMTREQRELDHKKDSIVNNQAELAQLMSVPGQLGKEIERINRKKMEVEKSKAALDEQLSEVAALQKMTEARCRSLEEEKREVRRQVEGRRAHLEAAEREHSMLQKEQEMTKEKEVIMMGQRGMLDINTGHCIMERKTVHENLARNQRERDRQLRELKKVELQLKQAQDALVYTQLLHDKTKSTRDVKPKSDRILKTRQEIQLEVDKLKRNLIHQQPVAEVETQLIEQCVEQEQELMRQSHRHREELHTLSCLTQIKADEREQKSRDRHRAEQRYHRIKQELRGKSLVIHELKKQNQEVQSRLGVFAKLYDNIKGDRNKCMNLIQMASQRTSEMREKFKILDNEIEILRTNASNKEKLLQKSRLKHFHSHTIRDSLRNDISKVTLVLHEMRQKREEQKLNLGRLTHMINYHEQNLLQMRKSHDNAVQSRNDRGVQLLEREEEMCIFYEKVNVQVGLIRDGNIEMQALEEETRCLQMITKEEGRQTALSRKLLPCQRRLKGESTMLQIQLSECKERMLELEKALEDPGQENRARELEGNDPSPVELIQKIEQLEVGLAEREELLLEKDLVFEQVTRLSQRIRAKAENGKQDTLQLAKKVNELQGRIKESTRRMMAVVSELSMRQASAMTLQQELKERELFLDTCHRRLDQGLPPSEDLEQEWQHILRDEQRRQADQQEKDRLVEEEERSQLPSGVYTTAEARPNAYIPLGDTLPLPKPYGALAPFKPSEPGTNIRHIRKPEPKPIEI
ncbi:coiled-coil domain-containing protein 146-like isoform X2 [Oncorhynchus mykiss]|uniref:Coiled-coil domain containing 146 n=1 Tax=Oncorhynchus mykiss TaxID=8022 RepID=A0A8K9XCY1_ONCMY|nr:coiled-coil domain-containing protein 146-like isoform X1 [Oncorhynchus mykiss]XP_036812756.1 coiled-coil domain-containing protein 146-like isoform X1 [Oncorhynchus mykiss]XP_036812757.1 coiled-coil domain-containing protein 146-like isoform X2 [Oncorhynchus mykiss]